MIYTGTEGRDMPVIQNQHEVFAYGLGGDDIIFVLNTHGGSFPPDPPMGHVEVYGGDGMDQVIVSGAGNVVIDGGADNDNLSAQNVQSATLAGGSGSDKLSIFNGSGVMAGGDDGDGYEVEMNQSVVIVEVASGGNDTINLRRPPDCATNSFRMDPNVEWLFFLNADVDSSTNIYGNGSDNAIFSSGFDHMYIHGGAGNDRIDCRVSGASRIYGNAGNDTLIVGAWGNATQVYGGAGNDVIDAPGSLALEFGALAHGGSGADTFQLRSSIHVADYDGKDHIELSDWAANRGFEPGALAKGKFCAGDHALDGNDRIIWDASTGTLYYDPDGSREMEQRIIGQLTVIGGEINYRDFIVT